MTTRLYYDQPELLEFDSAVEEISDMSGSEAGAGSRPALILRETAFYPTSGGQVHDTGWITVVGERVRVAEVVEAEDGRVVHYLETPALTGAEAHSRTGADGRFSIGAAVHGSIDAGRRRDHMQQHTGQHVLSAAFIELYQMPTVSFHMGEDYCSIDLAAAALTAAQVEKAEKRANEIVAANRPVRIRYVRREEAEKLGLRKLPPAERDELRLIEVTDFDLSACGGTHVGATGQIGAILLRKSEKTRQGVRVEFVCGGRAVAAARRDFAALTEAAALFSAQMGDVPEMIRKTFEESKGWRRQRDEALEELAEVMARAAVRGIGSSGDRGIGSSEPSGAVAPAERIVITRVFADRDAGFAKLFAQKAVRAGAGIVALVGSTVNPPGVVFAQTPGGTGDMGALLKQALAAVGGRGGGSRDFAQGGVPAGCDLEKLLRDAATQIR
ncbi:MAG: alanine--tRNA ligase-related protein [Terriglobales bacterium]